DAEDQKFISPLIKRINELSKRKIEIVEITDLADMENLMTNTGKNYFITASLNKFAVDAMLVKLVDLENAFRYEIQLVGHPNWVKSSFQNLNLRELNTIITSSYYVDPTSAK